MESVVRPLCYMEPENDMHMFRLRLYARDMWKCASLNLKIVYGE